LAIWAADVCSRAARQLICIEPTYLRLRHIGKTDPQCDTVKFCFHSGRLTCSARTGFTAVSPCPWRSAVCVPVRASVLRRQNQSRCRLGYGLDWGQEGEWSGVGEFRIPRRRGKFWGISRPVAKYREYSA